MLPLSARTIAGRRLETMITRPWLVMDSPPPVADTHHMRVRRPPAIGSTGEPTTVSAYNARMARPSGHARLLAVLVCLTVAPRATSQQNAAFDTYFTVRTMRVDYFHTGGLGTEIVA